MASLQTMQLLNKAALISRQQKESFSKPEILKKVNEIKYLSGQRKVPRLTLRKEIIHLENQLQGIMELEKKLLREKNKESLKVNSLKQQIESLKQKLRTEEGEFDKKVEKLTHLLGEHLAKKEISQQVAATSLRMAPAEEVKKGREADAGKVMMLQKRLEALKQELQIHKELESKNPHEIEEMEERIALIEEKLRQYKGTSEPVEVRHKMMFEEKPVRDVEVEKELPLPPPPRMER
ncbi:hypothetical protein HYV87_02440 [Candidatus Woesearchaeota archaeon]|nr:hypothetical protein [Candidatus Woesearchaeota archaeon]MBI2581966.1 hypothetical protein [Candidatus Woesearchaeota archaeon]